MTPGQDVRLQCVWARVAVLMYCVVLAVDLIGMQIHSPLGRSLSLTGAVCTVPLAFGLYYALKPQQILLAGGALVCRLLEAALGAVSVMAGYQTIQVSCHATSLGEAFLNLAQWDDRTNSAAFFFSMGSTLFFLLFVRSGYIPRHLAWLGLFASGLASSACAYHLVRPDFPAMTMYAWTPMLLAEISTGLWLLFKSLNVGPAPAAGPPGSPGYADFRSRKRQKGAS